MLAKFTLAVAAAFLSSSVSATDDDCIYAVEIIQLQDGSASFSDDLTSMQELAPQLFSELSTSYPGMKFGLASFVDKPLPQTGYGKYGGYQQENLIFDYCYKSVIPMTTDATTYQNAISTLSVGSGFDFQENQLEGMIRCALDTAGTGYSEPTVSHDASGRPIVRVMIVITDAIPHAVGDAWDHTSNFWNIPHSNKADGTTTGGFGADDFSNYQCILDKENYAKIVPYFKKMDSNQSLTADEQTEYDRLLALVGPYPWPAIVANPGDDSLPCETTEYPSTAQLGAVLKERNIFPVVLLATVASDDKTVTDNCKALGYAYTSTQDCLEYSYKALLAEAGVTSYVQSLTAGSADIVDAIKNAVGTITQEICIATTPAPGTVVTTAAVTAAAAGSGGDSGGGVPIGPIAGAAAGGLVAIAAGVFAYKKFGAGLMGGKTPAEDVAAPQVDVPEVPVEREALEEVTMEMFQ